MSRNDQTWRESEREADVAAVLKLGRYSEGECAHLERDEVRRVLKLLQAAMFNPKQEKER